MTRMSAPDVSIVIPAYNEEATLDRTLGELTAYFRSAGLRYELIVVDDGSTDGTKDLVAARAREDEAIRSFSLDRNRGKGAAVRQGVREARGEVVAFIDADLPYRLQNLGDAIALVQSATADIAIGGRDLAASEVDPSYPGLRRFMGRSFSLVVRLVLFRGIPDTQCGLKAFSRRAAKLLFAESKVDGFGFDFEILFLANRHGFRIERIPVSMSHRHESKVRLVRDSLRMVADLVRVRLLDAKMAYRAPRRCPVCFSVQVRSLTNAGGYLVRECLRCRCRYLAEFPSEEELGEIYNSDYFASEQDRERGYRNRSDGPAISRTIRRRLTRMRKFLPAGARVLEIGAGNGLFGERAIDEFEYVGIDLSQEAVRDARAKGLDVYCASLERFVNTGPLFDGVTLYHVFEHLPDPHDALATIVRLIKPGGHLFLVTPDTESLLCALSGDRWVSYKFPEHLILYSRSALIELLEQQGFEIVSASGDREYCDREFLRSRLDTLRPSVAAVARLVLPILPDPMPVTSGSIRIVARRRSGPPVGFDRVRAVEPTHAR